MFLSNSYSTFSKLQVQKFPKSTLSNNQKEGMCAYFSGDYFIYSGSGHINGMYKEYLKYGRNIRHVYSTLLGGWEMVMFFV